MHKMSSMVLVVVLQAVHASRVMLRAAWRADRACGQILFKLDSSKRSAVFCSVISEHRKR